MKKTNDLYLCAGIDISKDTTDVHYNNSSGEHHLKTPNDIHRGRPFLAMT